MEIMLLMVPEIPARLDIEYRDLEETTAVRDEVDTGTTRLLVPRKYANHILSLRAGVPSEYGRELWVSVKEKKPMTEAKND